MEDAKGLTVQRYDIESQGNDTPDVTAWTDKDGDWVKYTDYTVLAERLKVCERGRDCYKAVLEAMEFERLEDIPAKGSAFAKELGKTAKQRIAEIIIERETALAEVKRLKEKLSHAAEDW